MNDTLKDLYNAILDGQRDLASECVKKGLEEDIDPSEILNAMTSAMSEVGKLFEEGEYFVPEMLIAARAMKTGMEILKPKLVDADIQPLGLVVIGTVKGDLHDIGKNLVSMMLEGAGFQVLDLGADVAPETFVSAVKEHQPAIIAMSALLTTTMGSMKTTINALTEAGIRERVKVIIGGAPITTAYAKQIGADGYAEDASKAAKLAKNFILSES
jgi:5-methyltetrahydrofolate--homocysteine methyltransferase